MLATKQVTVAILLNSFVGAINSAEEEAAAAATQDMKSKEMLRWLGLPVHLLASDLCKVDKD